MRLIKFLLLSLLIIAATAAVAGAMFIRSLPKPNVQAVEMESKERIMNRLNTGVILLDRNGQEYYRFYQGRRVKPVSVDTVPQHVKDAVISAEDKDFYSHKGYSLRAMATSLVADIRHQKTKYGGSTITQQLVKNSFLTPDRSWERKYQELILARELESRYSKDEILEMYLNSIYFGEGAFGIGEAAQAYFSVPVTDLTVAQSAMLAGILTAPSALSPISGDIERARNRQRQVLDQMQENGKLTAKQREEAGKADIAIKPSTKPTDTYQAPHFAQMVKKRLIDTYGEEEVALSGFVVQTTIDLNWQKKAEEELVKQVEKLAGNDVSNGAVVVKDPKTGEIRALVGSRNWNDESYGKFNVALAVRQPGSSFKPIVYLSAIEQGAITPATILHDVRTTFGKDYKPENYDRRFRGNVSVRRSLSNSLNVPTVEVQQQIGVGTTLNMAKRLGITTLGSFSSHDLSIGLGSGETSLLEMTGAYGTLANSGTYVAPTTITKIQDKYGGTVFEYTPQPQKVVDPKYVYLVTSILSDNDSRKEVFGNALTISRPAAVKTGTSQDYKDSWTFGYTPSLVIGVWVGNNDGHPMDKVAGALGAAPIWRNLMEAFLQGTPAEEFTQPENVVQVAVCKSRGLLIPAGYSSSEQVKEYFVKDTEPTEPCYRPEPSPSPEPTPSPEVVEAIPEEADAVGGAVADTPLPSPTVTSEPTPSPTATPFIDPIPVPTPPDEPKNPPRGRVPRPLYYPRE